MAHQVQDTFTTKGYFYTWYWNINNDGEFEGSARSIMIQLEEPPSDTDAVVMCVKDVTIGIATQDVLKNRKLEALEAEYDKIKAEATARMQNLQAKIDELKALPAPQEEVVA